MDTTCVKEQKQEHKREPVACGLHILRSYFTAPKKQSTIPYLVLLQCATEVVMSLCNASKQKVEPMSRLGVCRSSLQFLDLLGSLTHMWSHIFSAGGVGQQISLSVGNKTNHECDVICFFRWTWRPLVAAEWPGDR